MFAMPDLTAKRATCALINRLTKRFVYHPLPLFLFLFISLFLPTIVYRRVLRLEIS